jgi:hypothetical protein
MMLHFSSSYFTCKMYSIWLQQQMYADDCNFFCISVNFQLHTPGNVKWIKVNANMTGVYRVHYDDDNWRALINQLWTNHTVSTTAFM